MERDGFYECEFSSYLISLLWFLIIVVQICNKAQYECFCYFNKTIDVITGLRFISLLAVL